MFNNWFFEDRRFGFIVCVVYCDGNIFNMVGNIFNKVDIKYDVTEFGYEKRYILLVFRV